MKTILALFLMATASILTAADNLVPNPSAEIFKAGEFNLELGGTATILNQSRSTDDLNRGLSLGVNYWITTGLGFGIRGESEDNNHAFVDRAIGRAMVRAPLWNTVAPYGYLEGGYDVERNRAIAGAGGGLEWRPGQGRIGFFAEAGLNVDPEGKGWMRGAAGIRIPIGK